MGDGTARVEAWRAHDSGLVAWPGPFRRLPGGLRHHRGQGDPWPDQVTLVVADGQLTVPGVGAWPLAEVSVDVRSQGPPVTFVVRLPGAAHLLSAAAGSSTTELLALLA
jgi:hypothetical protein